MAPCACKGRWVHLECLRRWRAWFRGQPTTHVCGDDETADRNVCKQPVVNPPTDMTS